MSNLEHLRKSAKRWLKELRSGDPAARERLLRAHPEAPAEPALRDVQHALARERGLGSWTALKAAAEKEVSTDGLPALLAAADRGDAAAVAALLDAEPALLNQRGLLPGHIGVRTALHFGVAHESVVRELLARGADPNVRDEGDDAYPLHFIAGMGELAIVRLLVEAGGDPYGPGTFHLLDVPGWATCFENSYHPEVARYLLEHGAPLTLFPAVALGETAAIARLAGEGVDLDQRMDEQANHRRTALHLAVLKQQPGSLGALLAAGADPNLEDTAGFTPLDQAALAGETAMAERLLAGGAELRLPAALLLGRTDEIERILTADPDRMRDDRWWARLLVGAAVRGSAGLIEELLRAAYRHRAGLSIVNLAADAQTAVDGAEGYTALHAAAGAGNAAVVEVLLRHGASPRARDGRFNGTPAGWARHFGHDAIADRLLEADIDLFDAIDSDRGDLVARILERDPEALDRPFGSYTAFDPPPLGGLTYWPSRESTPLEWATRRGHENARAVLAERADPARRTHDGERPKRAAEFLRAACWNGDVHGQRDHHALDRQAQRMLAHEPELARANLFTAIVCGEVDEVQRRLAEKPELLHEPGGPLGATPLLTLCFARFTHPPTQANAVAIARLLLEHGANPDDVYMAVDAAYTALVGVAGEGEQDAPVQPYAPELFELLLERGARPFDVQVLYNTHFHGHLLWWLELVHRHTALTRAAAWNDPEWRMFDMGVYGSGARFILELAIQKRDLVLAEWALERGANPNAAPARDWRYPKTPLHREALRQGFPEMARLLERHGATPDETPLAGRDGLLAAVLGGDRDAARAIVGRQPELKQYPEPILKAAELDRADAVALLLDLGVSPNLPGPHRETPLHRAAMSNSLAVARLLVARGAEIDAREARFNGPPLGWASHYDHREMVAYLGSLTRDFRMACSTGNVKRVKELLAEDPGRAREVANDGQSPLFWLPDDESRAIEIADALLQSGADPDHQDGEGKTAAQAALERGLPALAARLGRTRDLGLD